MLHSKRGEIKQAIEAAQKCVDACRQLKTVCRVTTFLFCRLQIATLRTWQSCTTWYAFFI